MVGEGGFTTPPILLICVNACIIFMVKMVYRTKIVLFWRNARI